MTLFSRGDDPHCHRVRIVLARPASADEAVLAAPPAFDLRVGEGVPVTRYLGEAGDASVDQVLQRNSGTGRIYGVLDRLHGHPTLWQLAEKINPATNLV